MKKTTLLFLALLALTSCECEPPPTLPLEETLYLNVSIDPVSLDPRVVRTLRDLTIVKQLFEGLMRLDQDGIPQPALAETVEISDDLLTYVFHLRQSYWSNKEPVTAYDFEYAWRKVLDPDFASDYAYMLYPIKNAADARSGKCGIQDIGVKAMDNNTLVVELQLPTPYFLELVAFPTYFPVNANLDRMLNRWACSPGTHFVSNGPFCLKQWIPDSEIVLEKNPLYWDSAAVELNALVFTVISDSTTESYLFEKKELDWLGQPTSNNIAPETLTTLKKQGLISAYPVAGTFWLKFNTQKEPFDHVKLRKAFAYAINRQEIITHILLSGGQCVATGPLPPCMAVHAGTYFTDADIQEAKRLFAEALNEKGWSLQTFPKIVLNYTPTERNIKMMQLIQQRWQEVFGIEIELAAVELQLYRRNIREGLYQVGTGDWIADFNDPLAFLELFKYPNDSLNGSGMNDTGWHHDTFTQLLDLSLTEKDPQKRRALLAEAEKLFVDEMPIAPIYHYAFTYAKKPYVTDIVLSPLGTADFKQAKKVPIVD